MTSLIYGICAAVAGTVLLVQLAMSMLGIDHVDDGGDLAGHGDAGDGGQHGQHASFFDVLSFRTVVAAVAFFGVAGLGGEASGWSAIETLAAALAAGAVALYGTYWLGAGLYRLEADATARPERAIGCTGSVYLRIPARRSGAGKVQVNQQGRTIEYEAVTTGPELATGRNVVVVGFVGGDVVEVAAAEH